MSREALGAVRLAVDEVKAVIVTLTPEEWEAPSRCQGWRVHDLVAHMSSNYKEIVDPSPPTPESESESESSDLTAEQMMEALVEPRRSWTAAQVRDEYLDCCDGAVAALAALQEEPLASTITPMADLGSYPMHQLADAFAFDHYCHLRIDLLAPYGPVRRDRPPVDAARLGPAIGWMLSGLPQMQPELADTLRPDGPLRLTLTGPGGGSWLIRRGAAGVDVVDAGDEQGVDAASAIAEITSDGEAFVMWGTRRSPWREHCGVTGDTWAAARFLDALNIV